MLQASATHFSGTYVLSQPSSRLCVASPQKMSFTFWTGPTQSAIWR